MHYYYTDTKCTTLPIQNALLYGYIMLYYFTETECTTSLIQNVILLYWYRMYYLTDTERNTTFWYRIHYYFTDTECNTLPVQNALLSSTLLFQAACNQAGPVTVTRVTCVHTHPSWSNMCPYKFIREKHVFIHIPQGVTYVYDIVINFGTQ